MKAVKYILLIVAVAFSLSSCTTTKAIVHNFSELAEVIAHPTEGPIDAVKVEEAYDTFMTALLKNYSIQDFKQLSKVSFNLNPLAGKERKTYEILIEAAGDIIHNINTRHVYKLPKSKKLPQGGFYICSGKIYNIPLKIKDIIHFDNPNTCNLELQDYCPSWSVSYALRRRIWQNNYTVFIFNKEGVLQKVVTSYMCPPRQNELEF